jgi:branched-chain amino acid transport system substrate-binding protein
MAKFMREYFPKKFTKVAIIYTIEEYGASGKDGLVAQLKKYDIEPVAVETHKIGDTDYSAQLLKIKGLNPEVIFLLSYSKDMGLILKQAHEIGLDCPKILYMGSDHPIIPSLAGKGALKEVYGPTNLLDAIRGGKLKSFIEMYEKEYPDYVKNPNNPSSSDVTSYVALQLLGEGLKRAGRDLTRTKFITAMESIKDFKSPWIPPMTFSATQHEGALQERFIKYVDGKAEGLDFEIK